MLFRRRGCPFLTARFARSPGKSEVVAQVVDGVFAVDSQGLLGCVDDAAEITNRVRGSGKEHGVERRPGPPSVGDLRKC